MSQEAENIVRDTLKKRGYSKEKIEEFLQKARKCENSLLQVVESCLKLTPSIEKGCQQALKNLGSNYG